jgi:hypothetical protein
MGGRIMWQMLKPIDQQLLEINTSNAIMLKENRRIFERLKKFIRYSGSKESEVSLLIHFAAVCRKPILK